MADAPAQAPSPAAAALLVRLDLEHPPPVERSTARIPGSGERSKDLVNVVEVEGGIFLPIAGLGVPRRSRKPLVLAVIGVVLTLAINVAIYAVGLGGVYGQAAITAGLRYQKLESRASDGAHIIIEYSLLVVLGSSEMDCIWKLVQYSGQFDSDVDTASSLMPLIVHRLQTAWGFVPTAEKTWN